MKQVYQTLLYILCSFAALSQTGLDTLAGNKRMPNPNTHCIVYLTNKQSLKGSIINITDSSLLLSVTDDSAHTNYQTVPISNIEKIKIRRNAFWEGMGIGAVGGGLLGYGAGYVTYNSDYNISAGDNSDNQRARGFVGALIGAVPGAIAGSIVGSISIKRNFIIDGKKENVDKMIETLWKLP